MNTTYTLELTESKIKILEIALALASRDIDNSNVFNLMTKVRKVSDFIKRNKG